MLYPTIVNPLLVIAGAVTLQELPDETVQLRDVLPRLVAPFLLNVAVYVLPLYCAYNLFVFAVFDVLVKTN